MTLIERNQLILDHLNHADIIACQQFRKTPRCVQLDDLKSAGYFGLVQAADKYNGNTDFRTFSFYRITGAIKDYLRQLAWKQNIKMETLTEEPVYNETSSIDEVLTDLCHRCNKQGKLVLRMYYVEELTLAEISKKIGLSVTRVHQIIDENLATVRSAA